MKVENFLVRGKDIEIAAGRTKLKGVLAMPAGAKGIVLFAHGSGSGRLSPRNNFVAQKLQKAGLATLLLDLLTPEEELGRENVFDIDLLTSRLKDATKWLSEQRETKNLNIGYFGASTGAAAALQAASELGEVVAAVVSRGGRPDLAIQYLSQVKASTLLIVGSEDDTVIPLNQAAFSELKAEKRLVIVPGAAHLFEEPGKLEEVARLASQWFTKYLEE